MTPTVPFTFHRKLVLAALLLAAAISPRAQMPPAVVPHAGLPPLHDVTPV